MQKIRKHNKSLTTLAKTLRRNMTIEENLLWNKYLKSYPIKFYRQRIIDKYIVDFYCSKARLVVELDGSGHFSKKGIESDEIRDKLLSERGLTVCRINNIDVRKNFDDVCTYIDEIVKERLSYTPPPQKRSPSP
ncbi:MAG: endonuclease domain-containing protein [Clostridia bacterium]|nr:endonuclease domain-containing protein [Clostridia bacterium]